MTEQEIQNIIEGVGDYLQDLFEKIPENHKSNLMYSIIFSCIENMPNTHYHEIIGTIETAKIEFLDIIRNLAEEE